MKFAFASDLHLEFGALDSIKTDADYLLLAGDIVVADDLRNMDAPLVTTKQSDLYDEFFEMCSSNYKQTYMIMGNHEHYHSVFQDTYDKVRHVLPDNVTLLENEYVDVEGVRVIGSTLWTDCDNGDWSTELTLRQALNDFRVVKWRLHDGKVRNFTPNDSASIHTESLSWMKDNMTDNTVVMSHHAPTWSSINEKFRSESKVNSGYASDLSEFILDYNPKVWVHGHMHDPVDYMVGDTRVVTNPRGYIGYEPEAKNFTMKVFEV